MQDHSSWLYLFVTSLRLFFLELFAWHVFETHLPNDFLGKFEAENMGKVDLIWILDAFGGILNLDSQ